MSFIARFDMLQLYEDEVDIDISACDNCPHRHGNCFNAGRCLMEDYE
jgi:hypothetical protein